MTATHYCEKCRRKTTHRVLEGKPGTTAEGSTGFLCSMCGGLLVVPATYPDPLQDPAKIKRADDYKPHEVTPKMRRAVNREHQDASLEQLATYVGYRPWSEFCELKGALEELRHDTVEQLRKDIEHHGQKILAQRDFTLEQMASRVGHRPWSEFCKIRDDVAKLRQDIDRHGETIVEQQEKITELAGMLETLQNLETGTDV